MSVRDLIWVNIAQAIKLKRKQEQDIEQYKAQFKIQEMLHFILCDCRELLLDTNLYVRLNAYKDTKAKRVTPFDVKMLPSVCVEQEKKEQARRETMTPDELAEQEVKDFLAGKTVRRNHNRK